MELEPGGRWLADHLDGLRKDLKEYFGKLIMASKGIRSADGYRKPLALIMYEQVILMGSPIVDGAIMDQPHIWLEEFHLCHEEKELYDIMRKHNESNIQSSTNRDTQKSPPRALFPKR